MSDTNYHRYPYPQRLLYEFGLQTRDESKYDRYDLAGNDKMYWFYNKEDNTRVWVKYDPDLYP